MFRTFALWSLLIAFAAFFAPLRLCGSKSLPQTRDLSIEVVQVLELPLNVHEASLTKTDRGYFLKLSLGNSSDLQMMGLRYSLATIDFRNQLQPLVNRSEGFSIAPYSTKTLTFKTPIKFKQKDGERLLLMVEQVISRESIWEVVKAKDALEAYARGDFSVVPTVLRVANQVDAPPGERRIYFRRN
jgi:hypothetical protein